MSKATTAQELREMAALMEEWGLSQKGARAAALRLVLKHETRQEELDKLCEEKKRREAYVEELCR